MSQPDIHHPYPRIPVERPVSPWRDPFDPWHPRRMPGPMPHQNPGLVKPRQPGDMLPWDEQPGIEHV